MEISKFIKEPSRPTNLKKASQPKTIRDHRAGFDLADNRRPSARFDKSEHKIVSIGTALPQLSARQREVLFWAAHGKSAWVTAQLMGLKEATVKSYIANACARLSADNKTHAVAIAFHHGIIGLMPNKS